jgi:short-subunit dehydrogenase
MNILILGATSSIARACATEFAARGNNLFLASRDTEELARIANDLRVRYNVKIHYGEFDAENFATHEKFWQDTLHTIGTIDGVLVAFGYLGNKQQSQQTIARNFSGAVSILDICANYFEQQKKGFVIGLSSVAGDRGRKSNYVYGAAKAALNVYLQGLRQRLFKNHIKVLTVKLGFVDTAMTFELPNLFLVAKPEDVAKKIVSALKQNHDNVYIPWFWRYIMLIIKSIPEVIFKRLTL